MSDKVFYFQNHGELVAVSLSHDLSSTIEEWQSVRKAMAKARPADFTRDEWSYLLNVLGPDELIRPFLLSFGSPTGVRGDVQRFFTPRKPIGVWLPNNVSMLGPLLIIYLSLIGVPVSVKIGSHGDNLAGSFLRFVAGHIHGTSPLLSILNDFTVQQFDQTDGRNAEIAKVSRARIVFGSDAACRSIESLPHPLDSVGFLFSDRLSEAWIDKEAATDPVMKTLIKVFSVYGQTACTSPRRVALLNGNTDDALRLCSRLQDLWKDVMPAPPMMHVASSVIMADQLARMSGWTTLRIHHNHAVVAVGQEENVLIPGVWMLPVVPTTMKNAIRQLPANIQTIGHALSRPLNDEDLYALGSAGVKRFVPLAQMHHFGTIWDGQEYWKGCFEEVECRMSDLTGAVR